MNRSIYLFLLSITLIGCNADSTTRNQIKAIDFFYYNSSPEAFSLKVTQTDSVFLKQYFNDTTTYFALLNKPLKQQYYSLIDATYFNKLDTVYESGDIDGEEYSFWIKQGAITKQLYVHSMKSPKKLDSLKNLFMKMKSSLSFAPLKSTIDFKENLDIPSKITNTSSR
jgi:hypothetical protein